MKRIFGQSRAKTPEKNMEKRLYLWLLFVVVVVVKAAKYYECQESPYGPLCTFANVTQPNSTEEFFETRQNSYIKKVVFVNSSMTEVPRLLFQKLVNLQNLTVNGVGLRDEVHKYTFEYANALFVLNLAGNSLTAVDKFAFNGARKLEIINLTRNAIATIDVTAVSLCINLKELHLGHNSLQYLSPDVFKSLENVLSIDLSHNQLEEIPKNLFSGCKKLRNLNLMHNKLTHIDLNLPYSTLEIDLSDNSIQYLLLEPLNDRTTTDSNELLRVVAVNNSIASFDVHPDFVVSHIDLTANDLKTIKNITKITTLIELTLAFNPNLGQLPLNSFNEMQNLVSLNLENTNLGHLDFGTFAKGAKLKNLDISYNNLEEIDLDMLAALSSLQSLSLNGNNLTKLDFSGLLELFPKLRSIGISNNNWDCKTLASIVKYLNKEAIQLLEDLGHDSPLTHNIKGISCKLPPAELRKEKQIQDFTELEETKARLAKITARNFKTAEKAEAMKEEAVVNSSTDIRAIKIMVLVLLLINIVFFGIKLGRYIKTKKSSRSIRLSGGGVKDENFMDDLVS